MDPISVIGLAGSIGGLIDITTRSILALLDLQGRYSDFGFKISQITAQLSTIRAVLKRIKDIFEISDEDILPNKTHIIPFADDELVLDFYEPIKHCEILIQRLDEQLNRFQPIYPSQSSRLNNARTRLRFLWDESEIDQYQTMLNNHISVLNLLFTVTRWFVISSYSARSLQ